MTELLNLAVNFAFYSVLLAMLMTTARLLIGPAAHDRVLAMDTLWICAMLVCVLQGLRFSDQVYFEVAMLIAMIGFVSSLAITKFLMRGEIIE